MFLISVTNDCFYSSVCIREWALIPHLSAFSAKLVKPDSKGAWINPILKYSGGVYIFYSTD